MAALSRLLLTLFTLMIVGTAHGYKVNPLVLHLEPTGNGSRSFLTIENTHEYPLTIELIASLRQIASTGVESEVDAEDDFLIFPPQAIIQPGQSQRIQLQYIGGPLETSRPYRITVSQVPVAIEGDIPRVDFNYIFRSAIYVVPEGTEYNLSVTSISQSDVSYQIEINNTGSRHAILTTGTWTGRSSDGRQQTVSLGSYEALKATALLPAESNRSLVIPVQIFDELPDLESLEINPER